VDFYDNAVDTVPPYAILSHRWMNGEEISYQEFLEHNEETKKKLGYRKILQACVKASNDNINFLWVDTCCIDKGNHSEVARNIKSMYVYYEEAEVCYAYLADVHRWDHLYNKEGARSFWVKGLFEESEWFNRGWTLQELLAPANVVFFDRDWNCIGERAQLMSTISSTTGIPQNVLEGSRLVRDVDARDRMSWAIGRVTTRPQDKAYCLLGILGVSMEPNYEENVEMAFYRLQSAFTEAYPEYTTLFLEESGLYSMLFRRNVHSRVGSQSQENRPHVPAEVEVEGVKPVDKLRKLYGKNKRISRHLHVSNDCYIDYTHWRSLHGVDDE